MIDSINLILFRLELHLVLLCDLGVQGISQMTSQIKRSLVLNLLEYLRLSPPEIQSKKYEEFKKQT